MFRSIQFATWLGDAVHTTGLEPVIAEPAIGLTFSLTPITLCGCVYHSTTCEFTANIQLIFESTKFIFKYCYLESI